MRVVNSLISVGPSVKCGYIWWSGLYGYSSGPTGSRCHTQFAEPPGSGNDWLFRSQEVWKLHHFKDFDRNKFLCLHDDHGVSVRCAFQFTAQTIRCHGNQIWDTSSDSSTFTSPHTQPGCPLFSHSPLHNARLSSSASFQSRKPGHGTGEPTVPLSVPWSTTFPWQPIQKHRHLPQQHSRHSGGDQTQ